MAIASYTKFDNDTLLDSHLSIYILLYTDSALMVHFLNLPPDIYPVFQSKSTVDAKGTNLNRKQIVITLRFAYTEYKV